MHPFISEVTNYLFLKQKDSTDYIPKLGKCFYTFVSETKPFQLTPTTYNSYLFLKLIDCKWENSDAE